MFPTSHALRKRNVVWLAACWAVLSQGASAQQPSAPYYPTVRASATESELIRTSAWQGQGDAGNGVADPAADPAEDPLEGLLDLSLERLGSVEVAPSLDLEVTSVSRTASTVGKSPAAIFVITNEMIRRSGSKTVPDVLRMVPGLNVAQMTANTWAISSRGFNGRFSNKLLVQIDGRAIYTPLFAGVRWDAQDVLLEDVERIEVIRGPGATVWGANAVNGIIN
ncbi:MAG: Plug domain-containing protein, partial [Planctomycetales bacterium]